MIFLPDLPSDLSPLKFHHVGMACTNLDRETKHLSALNYAIEGDDFTDPIQGVCGRFLSGQFPRIELLVPISPTEDSVLTPWLNSKIKMYHLAYETGDLDNSIQQLTNSRAKLVVKPTPAVAFDRRNIAFLMLPNMLLIELIQGLKT
jgi:methylmalonyl-CoA/ethylmalonyl-CoA epimerase